MKYYVIYVANGNLVIDQINEYSDLNAAKSKFFDVCSLMSADASVTSASVIILDSQLDRVKKEDIIKEQPVQAEKNTKSAKKADTKEEV